MPMTAAEHFEKAEYLLEKADEYWGDDASLRLATRAQAHLAAARLLFEIQKDLVDPNSSPGTAAYRAGLDDIADKRHVS